SAADPTWVQQHVPLDWYMRYGLRADQMRLPKEASKREALARQVGVDGYQLLDAVWAAPSAPYLHTLPALEALRQIWVQQYYRCTVPGLAAVRQRTAEEQPPAAVRLSPRPMSSRPATARNPTHNGWAISCTSARPVSRHTPI